MTLVVRPKVVQNPCSTPAQQYCTFRKRRQLQTGGVSLYISQRVRIFIYRHLGARHSLLDLWNPVTGQTGGFDGPDSARVPPIGDHWFKSTKVTNQFHPASKAVTATGSASVHVRRFFFQQVNQSVIFLICYFTKIVVLQPSTSSCTIWIKDQYAVDILYSLASEVDDGGFEHMLVHRRLQRV